MHATKIMAITAVELLVNPDHLVAIHREFALATGGKPYVCPIPDDVNPPQYGPGGDTGREYTGREYAGRE